MQRSRTGLRADFFLFGFQQGQDLELGDRPVVGASDVSRRGLEADLAQELPQQKRGGFRAALQDLLDGGNSLLDPR
jgi:hypothetical protein